MAAHLTASPVSLAELAAQTGATLDGDGEVRISGVAPLDAASPGTIAFLADRKYRGQLAATGASAVIVRPQDAAGTPLPKLVSPNPYATYARVANLLFPAPAVRPGVHPSAVVDPTATIAPDAEVGPLAIIGARADVGPRALVGPHCVVGDGVHLAEDVRLYARVTVYANCRIGARTIVHAGAVIGADGFGHADDSGRWIKIPQIGRVVIGADCEIGANTTIDRGAIGDTVLEEDVRLDNQIQIGHNCRIGRHTAMAGCTGVAGSVIFGPNCRIGGAAMISGHIEIAGGTTIGGAAVVIDPIPEPGFYSNIVPLMPYREWQRFAVQTRRLRELADRVRSLERAARGAGEGAPEEPR